MPDNELHHYTLRTREIALNLGFAAVGFAVAGPVERSVWENYNRKVQTPSYKDLSYLQNYPELRYNPEALYPTAKSLIVVAQNYYPPQRQSPQSPQVALYAYGKDYHKVMRKKMAQLLSALQLNFGNWVQGRPFCDSAPFMDVYWAQRAGIGFKGRSGLLIIPNRGSYFFLGTLITNIPLIGDPPIEKSFCGKCRRCIESCPTGALQDNSVFYADKCISYLTIEHKGDITDPTLRKAIGNHFYGCDECQKACPHNRFSTAHSEENLQPNPLVLNLNYEDLQSFNETFYEQLVVGSAMRRAGFEGLKRNAEIVCDNYKILDPLP